MEVNLFLIELVQQEDLQDRDLQWDNQDQEWTNLGLTWWVDQDLDLIEDHLPKEECLLKECHQGWILNRDHLEEELEIYLEETIH